ATAARTEACAASCILPSWMFVAVMIAGRTWRQKWSRVDQLFELEDHWRRKSLRLAIGRRRERRGAERHRGHFLIEQRGAAADSNAGGGHLPTRIDCECDRSLSGDHLVARGGRILLMALEMGGDPAIVGRHCRLRNNNASAACGLLCLARRDRLLGQLD